MKLSVYDMDRTITARPSWLPWLFFYARSEAPWRLLLAPLLLLPALLFLLGLAGRRRLKEMTQALMMGRRAPLARVRRAADAFAERFAAANELPATIAAIAADRAAGYEVWLATASCRYYAESLARRWGVETVIATENYGDGDSISCRIRGDNCYGLAKLRMILARLAGRPERLRFSSDHESDLPALLWADEAVAANPSPKLRAIALARGWEIR